MFKPKSIAVIGASKKPGKIGYEIMDNIISYGFKGELYPINLRETEILGKKVYRSISDVPGEVDFAIISIPAKYVLDVFEECGKKGVKCVALITSGFGEVGDFETEHKLVEIAEKYNMPFIGPNIFGIVYAPSRLNASFGPADVKPGKLAFITQSGALGIALMGWTITNKIGLSSIISIGNKAQIGESELLENFLKDDPNTKALLLYIEGLHDGRRSMEVFREVGLKKPIIALKSGRSKRGALAAASHTGSLAGSDKVYSAAFEQVGVLRAIDASEAFDWARCITNNPRPKGKNVVIITNGGGVGVMATDACDDYNLELYNDQEKLKELFFKPEIMPPFGSTKNPVDITGGGGELAYKKAMEAAFAAPEIDAIVVLYCQTATTNPDLLADYIIEVVKKYKKAKPFVIASIGGVAVDEMVDKLNENDIPAYDLPEKAISSLSALYRWSNFVERTTKLGKPKALKLPLDKIKAIIAKVRKEGRVQMLEHEAKEIFKLCNLHVPNYGLAKTKDEAINIAQKVGFPVVMKIVSEDIIHKSDAGGVFIGIKDLSEVEQTFDKIIENAKAYNPKANIRGVIISHMEPKATEVIIGVTRDPTFGPTVMFGLGGIYVEILKDVVFRVAPFSLEEAQHMIDGIKTRDMLYGARGQKPANIDDLKHAIYVISQLVSQVDDIKELDINPMFAMEDKASVVDARITLTKQK
ncbi:MAG: acetate--CoA ligase family protein [Candidatus Heimdallarchaeota archaeon]|nr:acetate--CoA ligase family protein [Candidatus Heimdallarchaeota archaeon]